MKSLYISAALAGVLALGACADNDEDAMTDEQMEAAQMEGAMSAEDAGGDAAGSATASGSASGAASASGDGIARSDNSGVGVGGVNQQGVSSTDLGQMNRGSGVSVDGGVSNPSDATRANAQTEAEQTNLRPQPE